MISYLTCTGPLTRGGASSCTALQPGKSRQRVVCRPDRPSADKKSWQRVLNGTPYACLKCIASATPLSYLVAKQVRAWQEEIIRWSAVNGSVRPLDTVAGFALSFASRRYQVLLSDGCLTMAHTSSFVPWVCGDSVSQNRTSSSYQLLFGAGARHISRATQNEGIDIDGARKAVPVCVK